MNARQDQLEIKIAYLEQANAQLGDEVFRLRQEMEALRAKLELLTGRFEAARESPPPDVVADEKPPHY